MVDKNSGLKRSINPMPDFVERELLLRGLMDLYLSRPAYQQNDYLGWINRAAKVETKQKRLKQMMEELSIGNLYMKMRYSPKK